MVTVRPMSDLELDDLRRHLAEDALAVCRRYLSNGRRTGNYWTVGDARNTPGRSMFVRLAPDAGGGKAGRWTDAATGEYGDLLDIIVAATRSRTFAEGRAEAEEFLQRSQRSRTPHLQLDRYQRSNSVRQAKRLFCKCQPFRGTLAETYLTHRGIDPAIANGLLFHPACFCNGARPGQSGAWPALVAPVTDANDNLTGVHRIYLDPLCAHGKDFGKAPIADPKRSLGRIRGQAVRFGLPSPIIVVAEGIENALSIRTAFPDMTVHAALSAGNLMAYVPLPSTRRLIVALDNDDAGLRADAALAERQSLRGLSIGRLLPRALDHNEDLLILGLAAFRARLTSQLAL